MIKPGKEFGHSERKTKRQLRIHNVRQKTEQLLYKYIPSMQSGNPNAGDYESKLPTLLDEIRKEFTSILDFREARNHLSRTIDKGNQDRKWYLNVPPYLIRTRRELPLRTENWFKNTRKLSHWHKCWLDNMTSTNSTSIDESADTLLSTILLSASFHGGLCEPLTLTRLANKLRIEDKPLSGTIDLVWLDLTTKKDGISSVKLWYPDTLSLACINKMLSLHPPDDQSGQLTIDQCWNLLRRHLTNTINIETKISMSFSSFCRSAIGIAENLPGVDIPQALVEYAIGRNSCTSLSSEFMPSLYQTQFEDVEPFSFDKYKYTTTQNKINYKRKTRVACEYGPLLKGLRAALTDNNGIGVKNFPKAAINKIISLYEHDEYPLPVCILLDWLVSLLSRGCAISTVRRYLSEVGNLWLSKTSEVDFNLFAPVDFENLYYSMLDGELSPGQAKYRAGRIRQIHEFCVSEFDFPFLDNSILDEFSNAKSSVRAGYINENLFKQLCVCINDVNGLDKYTKTGLICMLIICYRAGLRRGEALKLRLRDIESSADLWLYVRVNMYGNNKSTNGNRKIPLSILLTKEEKELITYYLQQRRVMLKGKENHLLFSMPHVSNIPHDSNKICLLVNYILRQLVPIDLTFHHLRHSALCKLQAVVEHDAELIGALTPYDELQASKIRVALVSLNDQCMNKDSYHALSCLAGHASPALTFNNYFHFSDRILGGRLNKSSLKLPASSLCKLSGLSSNSITRLCHELQLGSDQVAIKHFRPLLIKTLKDKQNTIKAPSIKNVRATEVVTNSAHNKNVSVDLCYAVLEEYEQGTSILDLIFKYHISEEKLLKWVASAKALYQLKTKHGHPRLFSSNRAETQISHLITPSRPTWKVERLETDKAINILKEVFKENKHEVFWCLEYFLTNNNMSNTGLRFNNISDIQRFMASFTQVFSAERWRIKYSYLAGDKKKERHLKLWKSSFPSSKFDIEKYTVKNQNIYPTGKGELFLGHPDENSLIESRKSQHMQKFSASNLRYILHMLSIMTLTKDQIMRLPSYKAFND